MFLHVLITPLSVSLVALAALPWWVSPLLVSWRRKRTPSLDDVSDAPPAAAHAVRVSVILPARNEGVHIADCVRAVLATNWPNLELIVVDDHSEDDTARLAIDAADGDVRFTLVRPAALADGWFGKQWACQAGQEQATGALLLFIDADTRHAPDLVTRMVRMRESRRVELLSVAGKQLTGTIWERAVQPAVFAMILTRYGSAEAMEQATRACDVIANGQCFLLSRAVYDAIGGHRAVRDFVAEDLMIAQTVWSHGHRVSLALGVGQFRVRMYHGLAELVEGWGKNVYAGGRFAMRGGALGRVVYPLVLLTFPLILLMPLFTVLLAMPAAIDGSPLARFAVGWAIAAGAGVFATFAVANRSNRDSAWRALLAPLGAAILLWICASAIGRGRRVRWKGRAYVAR